MNERPEAHDPVIARRLRLARLARLGQRLGYLGLSTGFSDGIATALVALLVAGSIILAPAIVLHYAVRAAAEEDRAAES